MKQILFICLLVFSPNLLFAVQTITTVQVKGFGVTRGEAIQNALIEALKQTKGVSINSKKAFSKRIQQKNVSINQENSRKIAVHSLSQNAVKEATKGLINSYRILNAKKDDNREWNVKLLVKILGYKSPGLSTKHRRKIAIMPFYYSKKTYAINGEEYSGAKVSDMLSQSLTNDFTQSRRFAVVDRTYIRDMSNELGIITSGQTPLSQKVKLGKKLSADYILVGTIESVSMDTTSNHNQLLGTDSSKKNAEFIVDYRIIVVGTSQIKWSATTKATIDLSNSRDSTEMALTKAVENITHSIADELLSNIYPMKIIKITRDGTIVLNQGGNSLAVGSKMDVMHLGERMTDPYTHEPLGRLEKKVAIIEIRNVTPKLSYAQVVKGSLDIIKKNDICRKIKSEQYSKNSVLKDNPNWRKSSVKVESNGGVKLPFD